VARHADRDARHRGDEPAVVQQDRSPSAQQAGRLSCTTAGRDVVDLGRLTPSLRCWLPLRRRRSMPRALQRTPAAFDRTLTGAAANRRLDNTDNL